MYGLYRTRDTECDTECDYIIGPPGCKGGSFDSFFKHDEFSQEQLELYKKIIISEADYGDALKAGDDAGQRAAFDETVRLQKELEKLLKEKKS